MVINNYLLFSYQILVLFIGIDEASESEEESEEEKQNEEEAKEEEEEEEGKKTPVQMEKKKKKGANQMQSGDCRFEYMESYKHEQCYWTLRPL